MEITLSNRLKKRGQMSLILIAQTSADANLIDTLRHHMKPINLEKRGFQKLKKIKTTLVIPMDHLLYPNKPAEIPVNSETCRLFFNENCPEVLGVEDAKRLSQVMRQNLDSLSAMTLLILEHTLGLWGPMSLTQIAMKLSMRREQVRQTVIWGEEQLKKRNLSIKQFIHVQNS